MRLEEVTQEAGVMSRGGMLLLLALGDMFKRAPVEDCLRSPSGCHLIRPGFASLVHPTNVADKQVSMFINTIHVSER